MNVTVTAAVSAANWVRAPIESFTAVRDPLAPTGNPCETPAVALAIAIARSSWSTPIRTPWRWASERAVRISSAKLTKNSPSAAGTRSNTRFHGGLGIPRSGSPLGM
jgi:hypothetical protein